MTGGGAEPLASSAAARATLAGRTLLVTGTTGIAAATVRGAAAAGAKVFVVGVEVESGESLVSSVAGTGGDCRFFAADVADPQCVADAVGACADACGRIDALFNVAGISARRLGDGPLHECTEEAWDLTFAQNTKSTFLVCREVIRRMLLQEPGTDGLRGAVLNMASVLAFSPEPQYFATHAYAASKGAIVAMSRSMASYYAPRRIRVNAIAPALVRTPMSRRAQESPEIVAFTRLKQPLAEDLLSPEEIADAALFLLGGGSRAITGVVLAVDGGWSVTNA